MTFKKIGLLVLTLSLFFSLSIVSQYNLISPYETNLDIALMLTPYGIIKNLVFFENYLTPYYWKISQRESLFNNWMLLISLILWEFSIWMLYKKILRKKTYE